MCIRALWTLLFFSLSSVYTPGQGCLTPEQQTTSASSCESQLLPQQPGCESKNAVQTDLNPPPLHSVCRLHQCPPATQVLRLPSQWKPQPRHSSASSGHWASWGSWDWGWRGQVDAAVATISTMLLLTITSSQSLCRQAAGFRPLKGGKRRSRALEQMIDPHLHRQQDCGALLRADGRDAAGRARRAFGAAGGGHGLGLCHKLLERGAARCRRC